MLATPTTMQTAPPAVQGKPTRKVAVSDLRVRDHLREAAGEGYDAIPGKDATKARVVGISAKSWSKREQGLRSSPLSRACEAAYVAALEARDLEEAGIVAATIECTLKSVAMWPALQKLGTRELVALLEATYDRETQIEGELNVLQRRRSARQSVCIETERRLWTEQAAMSERVMAILDILEERPDYVS